MKVGIITMQTEQALFAANAIADKLKQLGAKPIIGCEAFEHYSQNTIKYRPIDEVGALSDVIISVGGDGTFLKSAHCAVQRSVPILGINLGKVGYLTELEQGELDELSRLITGAYTIEQRMMLKASVIRNGKEQYTFTGLNDAVVRNGHIARILDITLYCNGDSVGEYRADGLLVSTPTGSTAYSLSAGGPVIDPSMSCLLVTALCPHSLNLRPILFGDSSRLMLVIADLAQKDAYLSVDGRDSVKIEDNDKILISKSQRVTKVIRLKNTNFNETLNKKLNQGRAADYEANATQ